DEYLQKLRQSVNDKNEQWHARYRTVDGNNVYGGRSALAYQPDKGGFITDRNAPAPYVSNYKVMQDEMSQRDALTANRDQRLWVAVWPNYPERTPDSKAGDSLLVFEDSHGDGKADKCTHFIDGLNAPTGFQFYKDGVLLMEAPDLWFIRDTNRDGKADWMER